MGFWKDIGIVRRSVAPQARAGTSGAAVYGGFVFSNESNSALTGRERYRTFSELIANVSIVSASVRYFLNLVAKAGWKVEPAEDSGARGEEIAKKVDASLHSMVTPWHRVVRRAAMYKFYGFSWQEWISKRMEDGSIGFFDVEPRPQLTIEQWDVEEDSGTVMGIIQRSPQTMKELYIPRAKSVYLVDDSLNDNPEGLGLLRHVVEPARRLARYEQLEGFGFETDLRGIPVGRAPFTALREAVKDGDITAADKAGMEKVMSDFVQSHIKSPALGLLLDSITYQSEDEAAQPSTVRQWDMDLLKGSSSGLVEVASSIQRIIREIARIFGTESILLGETGSGSLAMSRDKSANFALVVAAAITELGETFDKDIIEPHMRLNGWPMEQKPKLKADAIQHREISEITAALRDLAQAGAVLPPNDPAVAEVRRLLGLSRPIEVSLEDLALARPAAEPNEPDNGSDDEPDDEPQVDEDD